MGTKLSLVKLVEDVTGIPGEALVGWKPLGMFGVAMRFSWAAGLETTRVEDRA